MSSKLMKSDLEVLLDNYKPLQPPKQQVAPEFNPNTKQVQDASRSQSCIAGNKHVTPHFDPQPLQPPIQHVAPEFNPNTKQVQDASRSQSCIAGNKHVTPHFDPQPLQPPIQHVAPEFNPNTKQVQDASRSQSCIAGNKHVTPHFDPQPLQPPIQHVAPEFNPNTKQVQDASRSQSCIAGNKHVTPHFDPQPLYKPEKLPLMKVPGEDRSDMTCIVSQQVAGAGVPLISNLAGLNSVRCTNIQQAAMQDQIDYQQAQINAIRGVTQPRPTLGNGPCEAVQYTAHLEIPGVSKIAEGVAALCTNSQQDAMKLKIDHQTVQINDIKGTPQAFKETDYGSSSSSLQALSILGISPYIGVAAAISQNNEVEAMQLKITQNQLSINTFLSSLSKGDQNIIHRRMNPQIGDPKPSDLPLKNFSKDGPHLQKNDPSPSKNYSTETINGIMFSPTDLIMSQTRGQNAGPAAGESKIVGIEIKTLGLISYLEFLSIGDDGSIVMIDYKKDIAFFADFLLCLALLKRDPHAIPAFSLEMAPNNPELERHERRHNKVWFPSEANDALSASGFGQTMFELDYVFKKLLIGLDTDHISPQLVQELGIVPFPQQLGFKQLIRFWLVPDQPGVFTDQIPSVSQGFLIDKVSFRIKWQFAEPMKDSPNPNSLQDAENMLDSSLDPIRTTINSINQAIPQLLERQTPLFNRLATSYRAMECARFITQRDFPLKAELFDVLNLDNVIIDLVQSSVQNSVEKSVPELYNGNLFGGIIMQGPTENVLTTRPPTTSINMFSARNIQSKGTISLKICKIKANFILSSSPDCLTLPIDLKLNVHSLNLVDIQDALQNTRVKGSTNKYKFSTFVGELDVLSFFDPTKKHQFHKDISILDIIAGSETIQWVRNGVLIQDIQGIELNDGEELLVSLTLDSTSVGSLSTPGFNY